MTSIAIESISTVLIHPSIVLNAIEEAIVPEAFTLLIRSQLVSRIFVYLQIY